jgi:predicted ATPase/DNA-binding SARP family transcriptional activator/tetratricopeptide (TPR) repeat protein
MSGIQVDVLGPLRLAVDGETREVPGVRRRILLALLATARGQTVGVDAIVDALWGDSPPRAARESLQSHVSRLRAQLGRHADRLGLVGAGYRLELAPGALDADRAATLAREARAVIGSEPGLAAARLEDALACWRGTALEEFPDVEVLAAESARLGEMRLGIRDDLLTARLSVGRAGEVVEEAVRATAEDPWRESTVQILVQALAATGRTADALATARDFRRRLDDELGLEPSPSFGRLEQAVAAGSLAADQLTALPRTETPAAAAPGTHAGDDRVGPRAGRPGRRGIPVPPALLLGREAELDELQALVGRERVVAVVGPGGVGKTRLALEVGCRYDADTAALVELAGVREAVDVEHAVAQAVGVRGRGETGLLQTVIDVIGSGSHLVVLDNCEHVLDEARRIVTELTRWCPQLRILATSRQPLGVPGEWVYRLAPLPVTAPGGTDVSACAAVELFLDRARRVSPDFDAKGQDTTTVAQICAALDGLPLALELAAGQLGTLGLTELERRIEASLDFGPSGRTDRSERHSTLRATIGWSYDLLSADEQGLFRHLGWFPDRFELEAVEYVARAVGLVREPLPLLTSLVEASMVVAETGAGPTTYRMLSTVRGFALDRQLAEPNKEAGLPAGARWTLSFVDAAGVGLRTPDEADWTRRVQLHMPTLRTTRRQLLDHGLMDELCRFVVTLSRFGLWRDLEEMWGWAVDLAAMPAIAGTPSEAHVLGSAADAAWRLGRLDLAGRLAQQALTIAADDVSRGKAEMVAGVVAFFGGDLDRSIALFRRSAASSPMDRVEALATAAVAAAYAGRADEAYALLSEADRHHEDIGFPSQRAYVAYGHGEVLASLGAPGARAWLEEALSLSARTGATFVDGIASVTLAGLADKAGDRHEAARRYLDAVAHWRRTGSWTQQWTTLRNVADLVADAEPQVALLLLRAAAADPDAAALSEVEAARLTGLIEVLDARLDAEARTGLQADLERLPRAAVVTRAVDALRRAMDGTATSGAATSDLSTTSPAAGAKPPAIESTHAAD